MRVEGALCYILHTRPYLDSSALIECFSNEHGIVPVIAKGLKRPRSRLHGKMQPFILLTLDWVGKSELKTLVNAETKNYLPQLAQEKILLGLYLNELLIRLLQRFDPHPLLFDAYHQTIEALSHCQEKFKQEGLLRNFELTLLAQLGYGLNLTQDAAQKEIEEDLLYAYDPVIGIYEVATVPLDRNVASVSGASIIALAKREFDSLEKLKEAKKLMRAIFGFYLGNKPLQSRKLFYPI